VKRRYTEEHARAGISASLPEMETWSNQFPGYEVEIQIPEFTSVCPKTSLPDFGKLTLYYMPHKKCLELKSLKMYALAYRNLGIFYENVVNRFLRDVVKAAEPVYATVVGEFTPRGGLESKVIASWSRKYGFGAAPRGNKTTGVPRDGGSSARA
jgi:7-cyano-7-deazaguanine reductase